MSSTATFQKDPEIVEGKIRAGGEMLLFLRGKSGGTIEVRSLKGNVRKDVPHPTEITEIGGKKLKPTEPAILINRRVYCRQFRRRSFYFLGF